MTAPIAYWHPSIYLNHYVEQWDWVCEPIENTIATIKEGKISAEVKLHLKLFKPVKNMPTPILRAVKAFREIEEPARDAYEYIESLALDAYNSIVRSARANYEAIERRAWEQYMAITPINQAAYTTITSSALKAYESIEHPARKAYNLTSRLAAANYERKIHSVQKAYETIKRKHESTMQRLHSKECGCKFYKQRKKNDYTQNLPRMCKA